MNLDESKVWLFCAYLLIFEKKGDDFSSFSKKIVWNLDYTEKSFGKWCGKYNSCNSLAASYNLAKK